MHLAVAVFPCRFDAEQIVGRGLAQDAIEDVVARARLDTEQRAAGLAGDELETAPGDVAIGERVSNRSAGRSDPGATAEKLSFQRLSQCST